MRSSLGSFDAVRLAPPSHKRRDPGNGCNIWLGTVAPNPVPSPKGVQANSACSGVVRNHGRNFARSLDRKGKPCLIGKHSCPLGQKNSWQFRCKTHTSTFASHCRCRRIPYTWLSIAPSPTHPAFVFASASVPGRRNGNWPRRDAFAFRPIQTLRVPDGPRASRPRDVTNEGQRRHLVRSASTPSVLLTIAQPELKTCQPGYN